MIFLYVITKCTIRVFQFPSFYSLTCCRCISCNTARFFFIMILQPVAIKGHIVLNALPRLSTTISIKMSSCSEALKGDLNQSFSNTMLSTFSPLKTVDVVVTKQLPFVRCIFSPFAFMHWEREKNHQVVQKGKKTRKTGLIIFRFTLGLLIDCTKTVVNCLVSLDFLTSLRQNKFWQPRHLFLIDKIFTVIETIA